MRKIYWWAKETNPSSLNNVDLLISWLHSSKNFRLQINIQEDTESFIIKKNSSFSCLDNRININDTDCMKLTRGGFIQDWFNSIPWTFEDRLVDSTLIFTELTDEEFKKYE